MVSTVRDNQVRTDRTHRPPKPDSDAMNKALGSSNPEGFELGFNDSDSDLIFDPNVDVPEDFLEKCCLNKLEKLYNDAIAKLVALGYDKEVGLKAILRNGHCYGSMDPLTNILHNTLSYLNSKTSDIEDSKQVFANLKQLRDFSLACLVCLVRRAHTGMPRTDALWFLDVCDLNVTRATNMDVPLERISSCSRFRLTNVTNNMNKDDQVKAKSDSDSNSIKKNEKGKDDSIGVTPDSCKFHGGWGFGNGDFPVNRPLPDVEVTPQMRVQLPSYPDLNPTMNLVMKNNVALFAAEYKATLEKRRAVSNSLSIEDSVDTDTPPDSENLEEKPNQEQEVADDLMLKKFRDLNLEGDTEFVPEDEKDEMLLSLANEIKDLERQVKERKEWAHQKAMQAARKLSHDLTELKILRMEKDENQRLKQAKPAIEDPTMKRLSDMETALRKASGQVDRANLAVRRLEIENAEIRAEMEASKLSASESVTMCLEVARREKKYLKRLLVWEKQRAKLQEDITAEKHKITELQKESLQVEASKKNTEARLREVQKAKEVALKQVEEEKHLKEVTESNIKRRREALRSKIELDFQRYKDDLQRLEQELARIKTTSHHSTATSPPRPQGGTIARMLDELENSDDNEDGIDRACIVCSKDEVSIVFLPCAHQVLCGSCNEEYGKKGKVKCPTCRVPIEQRIRVFGASS